jgi:hypothetical protein
MIAVSLTPAKRRLAQALLLAAVSASFAVSAVPARAVEPATHPGLDYGASHVPFAHETGHKVG